MVNEGNITNKERAQKQLRGIILSYNGKVNPDECTYTKTPKGNWRVDSGDKKVCVISKFVLTPDVATELGIQQPDPEPPTGEEPK